MYVLFFLQAEDGILDLVRSRGLGDVYKRQVLHDVGMSSDWRPMYRYNLVRNRLRFGRYVWGQRRGFLLALAATCLWVVQRLSLIHI